MNKSLGMNFMEEHGKELAAFIKKGLQSEFEVKGTDLDDGMQLQVYEEGPWSYENRWIHGEPATGITIVRYEGTPCWSMVYFSRMLTYADRAEVYATLRTVFAEPSSENFLRGPCETHLKTGYSYFNVLHGALARFDGLETVKSPDEDIVFKILYRGGAVCVY